MQDLSTCLKSFDSPVFDYLKLAAQNTSTKIYVVGGYVRDLFMQRPSKDIDILVLGSGIEFAEAFSKVIPGSHRVNFFKNFGTAQVVFDDLDIEFVGARKESYNRDSRKPIVEEGTLLDDLSRRDFTINAMAIELWPNFGELQDPFDGYSDIEKNIIRTPLDPTITFSDDPLRMMRAIRFKSQLGFELTLEIVIALETNASRLEIISNERIMDELNKIILSNIPSVGFKILYNTKLLHQFFPEMVKLQGVKTKNGLSHKDNFYHTLQVLDNICTATPDLWLRWAAILHDIAKPATQRFEEGTGWTFHGHEELGARWVPNIFRKMKLPLNEKMKFVQKLVRLHLRPIALTKTTVTDSAVRRLIFEAGDDIDSLMTLCKADITSNNDAKVKKYLRNFELLTEKIKEVEAKDHLRNWQPPVTGEDIMEYFGLKEGREIGIIKNAIREHILDGNLQNERLAALEFMVEEGEKLGLSLKRKIK